MTSSFFRFWKQKGTTRALRELAGYEVISKNLVGNVDPVICLGYELCSLSAGMNVFLGWNICKNIIDMV